MSRGLEDYILNVFTFVDSKVNTFKTKFQRVDNNIDYYILKNRQTNSSTFICGIVERSNETSRVAVIYVS